MWSVDSGRCKTYVGLHCFDGTCPFVEQERYDELGIDIGLNDFRGCIECSYFQGCTDCIFSGPLGCIYD